MKKLNIRNKKIKLIIIVLILIAVLVLVFNRHTISEYISGERKIFGAFYSGTCGTSNWTINNSGVLTIQSGTLPNIDMQNRPEWYQYREAITSVQINSGVSTSGICEALFQGCVNLTTANVTRLNTSNATHLGYMFDGCTNLTNVTFGTNVVKDSTIKINSMFQNCSSLQVIDLSNFNTNNVVDMSNLFWGCTSLNSITWGSNFNTSKVTNFQGMFGKCNSLPNIDLSGFNTNQAINMNAMFLECQNIITLDLTSFNTSNVISGNMSRMLEGMTKCNILILGSDFRFKKTSTSECQVFTTNDTLWRKSGTTTNGNSVLLLENDTNPTGTWLRQYYLKYYGDENEIMYSFTQASDYATYNQEYHIRGELYSKGGYTFAGWTMNSDGSDDGNNWNEENIIWNYTVGQKGIKSASVIELYTKWKPYTYTIVYKGNGGVFNGSDTYTETVYYGEMISVAKNKFSKKGNNFSGWKDSTGVDWTDWGGIWKYTNGQYGITDNTLTLTAQWAPKTYTIKYDGNGGLWQGNPTWSGTVTYGQTYTVEANFYTKAGYNFASWLDPSGVTWNPNTSWTWSYDNGDYGIENDTLILTAHWLPKRFTIKYNGNGGTWQGNTTWTDTNRPYFGDLYKVVSNKNFYVKSGYTFIGWSDPSNEMWEENWYGRWIYDDGRCGIQNQILNLQANWGASNNIATMNIKHFLMDKYNYPAIGMAPITYTQFDLPSNEISQVKKVPGTEIYIPGFKRDFPGYTLENYKGYLNNPNTGNGIPSGTPQELGTIINGANTLDLYYRPNRLYMTFNTNGGILAYVHGNNVGFDGDQVIANTTTGNREMALGLYDTNVGGVTFDYYAILESNQHDFPDINNEARINLRKLGYSPKNKAEWYTVDCDYNFVKEYDQSSDYSDTVNGPPYSANDVAAEAGYDLSKSDVTVNVFANWIPNNYDITFNPTGGTVKTQNKTITYDASYGSMPVPEKDGNTFKAWSLVPDGYTQLEYIQSSGGQYINTGFVPNQYTGVIADYQFNDTNYQQRVFGVTGDNNNADSITYHYYINGSGKMAYSLNNMTGNYIPTSYTANTSRHKIEFNLFGNSYKLDNNKREALQANVNTTPSSNAYLYLFAENYSPNNGSAVNLGRLKLYGLSIYDNETLVHQYIPCQNSAGVVGLYDIVAGEFKSNAGTGTFTAGPEKNIAEADLVSIAENHTLYAKWNANEYTIEYYRGNADVISNSGSPTEITKLGERSVPISYANDYTLTTYNELGGTVPRGWRFAGWGEVNVMDSTVVTYQDGQSVNSLSSGKQTNSEQTLLRSGQYVKYINSIGEEIICRVLYDNDSEFGQNGVQIIPINCTKNIELSGTNSCNITNLNDAELSTLNYSIASGIRSVGSLPYNKNICDENNQDDNKNYRYDFETMNSLGINDINNNYWLASEGKEGNSYYVSYINSNGQIAEEILKTNNNTLSKTYGYRPVYILNSTIFVEAGDGSENNPYIITGYSRMTQKGRVKLYAIFERDVKFNSGVNGATSSTIKQYFNPIDSSLTTEVPAPQPSFEGMDNGKWNCIGYSKNSQLSNCDYKANENVRPQFNILDSTNPNSTTLNLYALYERYLTMTYDGNNATSGSTTSHRSNVPQYYSADGSLTSYTFQTKSNGFIKNGYEFNKWAEDSVSGNQYAEGANVIFSPAVNSSNTTKTMYALWNIVTYSITYDLAGGTLSTSNPDTYTIETPTFTLVNPSKNGYVFSGWTGTGIDTPQKNVTIPQGSTGDRTYIANWAENIVNITVNRNDTEWSNSGMKVGLYQNGVEKYSTVVTTGDTAIFHCVETGIYDIYAGKNSNEKTAMVDTGKDIEVSE